MRRVLDYSRIPPQGRGPVQVLCEEIDFAFDKRLERADVFVAFVRSLVEEIAEKRELADRIAYLTTQPPSEGSAEALALATTMLDAAPEDRIEAAKVLHDACDRLNPDDARPTDHLIDMLSSCASAIRFGLEKEPSCTSRHAAHAAQHVWKQRYGISLFDRQTGSWEKAWARGQLMSAVLSILPPEPSAHGALCAERTDLARERP